MGGTRKGPAYWPSGVRHTRGMSVVLALVWNVGTLAVMGRENPISGGPTKGESIEARQGGGSSRSSEEVRVMRMERRG